MTQLTITSPNEAAIDEIVKDSGLVLTDATEIKGAYLPFLAQLQEVVEQAGRINAENPTDIDEKIARELRLKAVKIRTGSEKLKDERKKGYLIKGNLEQASYNVIKNSCLLAESALEEVEKAREKKEAARKEALRIERLDLLKPYCDNPEFYPLGEMDESGFNDLLNGMKLQAEAKVKAEQDRLEAERLLAEKKEIERIAYEAEQERIRKENEALKAEAERKDKVRNTRNEELRPYIVFIRDYKAMLDMDETEYQKELSEVKKGAELQWEHERKEIVRKAKEDAEKERQLEKERADAKRIADELKAKQDKEEQDKRDAEAAEKKRISDEKKLAKAPDKDKLNRWVDSFDIEDADKKMSAEADVIAAEISTKFYAFKEWAKKQVEAL